MGRSEDLLSGAYTEGDKLGVRRNPDELALNSLPTD